MKLLEDDDLYTEEKNSLLIHFLKPKNETSQPNLNTLRINLVAAAMSSVYLVAPRPRRASHPIPGREMRILAS